jgi:hypothetical protein
MEIIEQSKAGKDPILAFLGEQPNTIWWQIVDIDQVSFSKL